jgi:hypothetical protein
MRLSKLRILSVLIASVAVLFAVAASAQTQVVRRHFRPPPHPVHPVQAAYSVRLEDAGGTSLRSFAHRGQTFVLGESGERFVIAITNPTAQRVEAVVSVDGRDAITGQPASWSRHRGYLVSPGATVRIDGFRQSLDDVATFRFTPRENSYSARMGTPENVGMIAVAFFPERNLAPEIAARDHAQRAPAKRERPSRTAAGAPRAERESNIGTEFGETRTSRVVQVPFDRASRNPARILSLRYDDAEGLMARGIELFPRQRRIVRPLPQPLPLEPSPNARFAPPPPPAR